MNTEGSLLFWVLIVLLAGIYIANITGPTPPDVKAIG